MTSVEELVRAECRDYYEQRGILVLRILAALSDPDIRSTVNEVRWVAQRNKENLVRLVSDQWKGRRGPQFGRVLRRAQYQLIDDMTDTELIAFRDDVFRELERAV